MSAVSKVVAEIQSCENLATNYSSAAESNVVTESVVNDSLTSSWQPEHCIAASLTEESMADDAVCDVAFLEDMNISQPLHSFTQNSAEFFFVCSDLPDDFDLWVPRGLNDDSDDECDVSETTEVRASIRDELAQWTVRYNVSQTALSALLAILKTCDTSEITNLPKDARTLRSIDRHINIRHNAGGDYYYFGIEYWLSIQLKRFPCGFDNNHIKIMINVDGIPLFHSASVCLWPILGSILDFQACPFPIAIFCSKSKPTSVDEFLKDFVLEMKCLEQNGIDWEGQHFSCELYAIICDAPARAFLKCIKTHCGYNSCERCSQHGEWCGKVIFPELSAELRTDSNFRSRQFPNHHSRTTMSPLIQLSCDMVSNFPLDYMHLVCLGVMRRLLHLWICGPRSSKLSQSQLSVMSQKLTALHSHVPREFSRKPRSVTEYKTWKATELRLFLLYSGPVVLKGTLSRELYEHFLVFSVAIRVLLTPALLAHYLQYAEDLLRYFVASFAALYGQNQLVYNVHALIHLADDARIYGALDIISAFKFESYLGRLKKLVRRPHQPCVQIVRRLLEGHCQDSDFESTNANGRFKKPHMEGPLPVTHIHCLQFKLYYDGSHYMSVSDGDNCFEIDGKLGVVRNILQDRGDDKSCGYVIFEEFIDQNYFFNKPLDSRILAIFYAEKLSGIHTVFSLNISRTKYVLLPYKNGFVALPQMHTS